MELLEPVPSLQPMCQEVVLAVIEFAKIEREIEATTAMFAEEIVSSTTDG